MPPGEKENDKELTRKRKFTDDALSRERQATEGELGKRHGSHRERHRPQFDCDELMSHFSRLLEERAWTDEMLRLERKRTDEALKEGVDPQLLKKAESSLISMAEILAIVSHDLRNPLATIDMAAEAVLLPGTSLERARDLSRMIRQAAGGMLLLIADLMDAERARSGAFPLNPESFDLSLLIREVVDTLQLLAHRKKLKLECAVPREAIPVTLDRSRFSQTLGNLLENALKFTPEGGRIVVSVDVTETEVHVVVSDTGPGIPREDQGRIFERFSQINQKERRGLGLGLFISRAIVEAHGGRIWVESEVGRGSEFHVAVPCVASSLAMHG